MERLNLILPLIDYDSVSMVNKMDRIIFGLRCLGYVPDRQYRRCTLPETTFVAKSFSGSSKLDRLEKISLCWVVIKNIVRHCPNLNHLDLEKFCGLKTLQISKLYKL